MPNAKDVPPTDFKKILSVDSSNPNLRELRIKQGFLKIEGETRKDQPKGGEIK
jgi:hypothetical protein